MTVISVCIGSDCHLKGSYNVIDSFQRILEEKGLIDQIEIKAAFCMGNCAKAVCVRVDDEETTHSVSGATARRFFEQEIMPRIK